MNFFNIKGFMPHGHCYRWKFDILLLNVGGDIIISICYFAIPLLLTYILIKRKDIPFKSTIVVFIVFIFFCAITHIMEIVNVWFPYYRLAGVIKAMTAIISIASTVIILKNLNKILSLPSLKNLDQRLFGDMYQVMQKLPVGVIFSDKKGKINYHNDYINQIFKFDSDELRGQDVEILIKDNLKEQHHKYKVDYFENPIEKTMGGGRVLKGVTKDGEEKFLEIGLRPIPLKTNSEDLTLVAIKDITVEEIRKREIEEALHLINVATYGMPSLLSFLNKDGHYQFVNEAYTRKWNIDSQNILKKHYKDFLPENTANAIESKMNLALSGEELNFKITVNFPLEGKRELDVFYIPYRSKDSGKVEGVVVLAHDITELNKTLKELEMSNKQLEEYAFLVSHDLRAPVRHISNFVELLLEELQGKTNNQDKINKYTDIIMTNTEKMQNMISGMLKIASINQVTPNKIKLNLKEYFINLKEKYDNHITFEISIDNSVEALLDPDLLNSVFSNLIENSINFSKTEKARINVRVEKSNNKININYQDFGKGIERNMAKSIFNPFIKSDDSKGLGLGMTIITRSLEKLNGEIKCIPSLHGAIFSIEITE